jgi:hypothetical protein
VAVVLEEIRDLNVTKGGEDPVLPSVFAIVQRRSSTQSTPWTLKIPHYVTA